MTRHQTFKRRVRGRMAKTGESYTTARRQVLARAGDLFSEPVVEELAPRAALDRVAADRGRRQLLNRRWAWVEEATGQAMETWFALLDQAGARQWSHHEIWRWLAETDHMASAALREALVITYEQQIGRREVGQSCDGDYPAQVRIVLQGTLDDVLQRWLELVGDTRTVNGAAVVSEPSVSRTEKFRYWRARLANGTKVTVSLYQRPDGRASLSVQQRAFPDRATADVCKAYWKQFLAPLTPGRSKKNEGQGR